MSGNMSRETLVHRNIQDGEFPEEKVTYDREFPRQHIQKLVRLGKCQGIPKMGKPPRGNLR